MRSQMGELRSLKHISTVNAAILKLRKFVFLLHKSPSWPGELAAEGQGGQQLKGLPEQVGDQQTTNISREL